MRMRGCANAWLAKARRVARPAALRTFHRLHLEHKLLGPPAVAVLEERGSLRSGGSGEETLRNDGPQNKPRLDLGSSR